MFSAAYLFTALTAFVAVVSAAPAASGADIEIRGSDAIVHSLCRGFDFTECFYAPATPNECINFKGFYGPLNKHLRSAIILQGYECTLYEFFACSNNVGDHSQPFKGGEYPNFRSYGWNDRALSMKCVSVD